MRAYEEYKDSGYDWLGEIPAHWIATKLRGITKESNERRGARQDLELLSVYREPYVPRKRREPGYFVRPL